MALAGGAHARSWWTAEQGLRYERGRPGYPAALAQLLARQLELTPTSLLADVAAGTGKLTRLLSATPAEVMAVEPMPGMRAELRRQVPAARVVAGRSEQLPFADGRLDAVTVAQAFHWFDVPRASAELRRVLRRQGRLVLVTNRRHTPQAWLEELWAVLRRYERLAPRPAATRDWRPALHATGDFGPFERFELAHEQRFASLDELDDRFRSVSFVILLSESRRQDLLADVHRAVAGVDPLIVPLRTEVEIAVRRP